MLFSASGLAWVDFRCGRSHGAFGPEEVARSDSLVFVRAGSFERECRGERDWADPSRVLLFRRGDPYRVAHPAGGHDACTVLALDRERAHALFEAQGASLDGRRWPERLSAPLDAVVRRNASIEGSAYALHARLVQGAQRGVVDALEMEESLDALAHAGLAALSGRTSRSRPARESTRALHAEILREVQRILALRACEPLRLADVARAIGWSPFHLSRSFRAACGIPLTRYRNRLRLRQALARAASGERDLARIAVESGFASHSHLAVAFRREFGFSPSSLRRPLDRRTLRELHKKLEA